MPTTHARHRPVAFLLGLALVAALVPAFVVGGPSAHAAKGKPALVVKKVSNPPQRAKPGERIAVVATVANRAKSTTPPTTLRLYLSKDRRWSRSDLVLSGGHRVKPVKKGRTASVKAAGVVAQSAPAGNYHVVACVGKTPAANRCRASVGRVTISRHFRALLAGRLTLTDQGEDLQPDDGLAWDRSAHVDVRIDVSGSTPGGEWFVDADSSYELTGTEDGYSIAAPCRRDWDVAEGGAGPFQWTGDPFTDEIGGHFTNIDRRGVRVWLFMHYERTTTTVRSGPAPECTNGTTVEGPNGSLDVASIEFTRIPGSNPARYQASEWQAEMGMESRWDSVAGTLVLTER